MMSDRRSLAIDDLHRLTYQQLVAAAKTFDVPISKKKEDLLEKLRPHVIAKTLTMEEYQKILNHPGKVAQRIRKSTKKRRGRTEALRRRTRSGTYTLEEPSPTIAHKHLPVVIDPTPVSDSDTSSRKPEVSAAEESCSEDDVFFPLVDAEVNSTGTQNTAATTGGVSALVDSSTAGPSGTVGLSDSDKRARLVVEHELERRLMEKKDGGKSDTPEFMRYLRDRNKDKVTGNKDDAGTKPPGIPNFQKIHAKMQDNLESIDEVVAKRQHWQAVAASAQESHHQGATKSSAARRMSKGKVLKKTPRRPVGPLRKSPRFNFGHQVVAHNAVLPKILNPKGMSFAFGKTLHRQPHKQKTPFKSPGVAKFTANPAVAHRKEDAPGPSGMVDGQAYRPYVGPMKPFVDTSKMPMSAPVAPPSYIRGPKQFGFKGRADARKNQLRAFVRSSRDTARAQNVAAKRGEKPPWR